MKVSFILWSLLIFSQGSFAANAIALKNAKELYASFESVTGVDGRDPELRELFRLNIDRLPKTGSPEELSSSVVLAATEVAGAFCKKAVAKEKAQSFGERRLFGEADFKRGPSQWSEYSKSILLDHLALVMWQRNISEAEAQLLSKTMSKAATSTKDTVQETENILQVMCTTYATSLAFLVK